MQAWPVSRGEFFSEMGDQVRQTQMGDVAAFEALYRRHVGRVYGLCLRLARDPGRAEELVQEVFLRVWERGDPSRSEPEFDAWIRRVAINLALSDVRAKGRRTRLETPVEDPDQWTPSSVGPEPGKRLDLERAIEQLPTSARRVLVLHDVEGYRHEEIGRMLGSSTGTSKSQLHRARRALREALKR
jgi:RNA polymerase sigma-70 factor (ECF subfamily)